MSAPSVESPCVRLCTVDPMTGLCLGCGRTLDEIAGWSTMSDGERQAVNAVLTERMAMLRPKGGRACALPTRRQS